MKNNLDVYFVTADSAAATYQALSQSYTAIEPPTWSLILAQSCRAKGFGVGILDATAERLTHAQAVKRIGEVAPRLACFVVYGQNPNSGTTNMSGNVACATLLKSTHPEIKICFVGSHTSALPLEVLALGCVDFVLLNEGVYALHNLLRTNLVDQLENVKGIGYKKDGQPLLNAPQHIVPQDKMDTDMPGYAWDLLPYDKKPLDLYRAHFWHAEFDHHKRTPFAAIYTSLGCKFKCDFCMINIINRDDNSPGVSAANSPVMRYWSPQLMLGEFKKLAEMGVTTLRISDEMFFLNRRFFEPLLDGLAEMGSPFRMWCYSRVDTVRKELLDKFRAAGINWFCLGIEAANQVVRQEVSKGTFKEINIREVVRATSEHGINIISNFIYGFPDDTRETMQQTLDLALELNCAMTNFYPCMPLPGSTLFNQAVQNGWKLPDTYSGYGFLSYDCQPMPTKTLTAGEVLKFRDESWHKYFTHPAYLDQVERKFGHQERLNVQELEKIHLRRRLLGD